MRVFRSGEMPVTVLIADDEPWIRETARRLLERQERVRVVGEAKDGEEAVRLARALQPTVVLIDIAMPHVDGLEASRRIKSELPEVKIVIMTAHEEAGYRRAAHEIGAFAFLPKKALMTELLSGKLPWTG
jgi:DNA-binding NarL/FixJ family response regulator